MYTRLAFTLFVATLTSCSDSTPVTDTGSVVFDGTLPAPLVFVGTVSSDVSVSVALVVGTEEADDGSVVAALYVCNGVDTAGWFLGTVVDGQLEVISEDGGQGTGTGPVAADAVTGSVDLPGKGKVDFALSLATGIAGIYLVDQETAHAEGYSATGAHIEVGAVYIDDSDVSGTVTPLGGTESQFEGTLHLFGDKAGFATWIVQPNGDVKGRACAATPTGTAGGCTCSIWQKIKSMMRGVH